MDNTILGILFFAAIVAIAVVWQWLENKADAAMNRNVFNRKTYREQQEITGREFRYPCTADWSDIRPLLNVSPFDDKLEVTKDQPNGIQWAYHAIHLRTVGGSEFTAYLVLNQQFHRAEFGFINWTTVDDVVRNIDEMKTLKSWVEDVVEQANRNARQKAAAANTAAAAATTTPAPAAGSGTAPAVPLPPRP
ncbi:hypothetical protein [Bifidobacterium leontopitheci]|uniref:Uncharacterized protein n=1 Tax=Bifidobacterium leontopitheci TaxID=2650774 RepID=A0A6I1GIM1_9BIFI|nr:hypothetical protein [Bifidobacterium leontopitheci]KAB7791445.1 hypothetical protein F7D09_0120 [Bifidobacterium leontopitheci]